MSGGDHQWEIAPPMKTRNQASSQDKIDSFFSEAIFLLARKIFLS